MVRVIGVISDTHGLLRKEAKAALKSSDLILHAGDIGNPEVISELEKIAPLTIIRGNVDKELWAQNIPHEEYLEVEGHDIYLIHNLSDMTVRAEGRFSAVVFGHSHEPYIQQKGSVLYFNPGSAGPRRFRLPVTLGRLYVSRERIKGEIISLT